MDDVRIPTTDIPAELKAATEQTLKRANELKKADPVVSYWCCFWAAQKALKVPNRSKEGTVFLMSLLDALEAMKTVLANNEAVTNELAGAAYMENFALKVFLGADNEDRAGKGSKATVQKFMVATQFIDVLNSFEGGVSEEMEQKQKYAKWKAADIAKALREGRTPVAGPPVPEDEELEELSAFPSLGTLGSPSDETSGPTANEPAGESPDLASPASGSRPESGAGILPPPGNPLSPSAATPLLPSPPTDPAGGPSEAWSRTTTLGTSDSNTETGAAEDDTPIDQSTELKDVTPRGSPDGLGPDDGPHPPSGATSSSSSEAPFVLPTTNVDPFSTPAPTSSIDSTPPALPSPPPPVHSPPVAPTTLPSAPPARATPRVVPTAPPLAPSVAAASSAPRMLSMKESDQFKKHCRFAISAMDYDDTETARKELLKALAMLG